MLLIWSLCRCSDTAFIGNRCPSSAGTLIRFVVVAGGSSVCWPAGRYLIAQNPVCSSVRPRSVCPVLTGAGDAVLPSGAAPVPRFIPAGAGGGVSRSRSWLAVIVAGSSPPRRGCRSVDQLLEVELRCRPRVRGGRSAAWRALSGVHRFRAGPGGSSPGLPAAPGRIGGSSLVRGAHSSVSPSASR